MSSRGNFKPRRNANDNVESDTDEDQVEQQDFMVQDATDQTSDGNNLSRVQTYHGNNDDDIDIDVDDLTKPNTTTTTHQHQDDNFDTLVTDGHRKTHTMTTNQREDYDVQIKGARLQEQYSRQLTDGDDDDDGYTPSSSTSRPKPALRNQFANMEREAKQKALLSTSNGNTVEETQHKQHSLISDVNSTYNTDIRHTSNKRVRKESESGHADSTKNEVSGDQQMLHDLHESQQRCMELRNELSHCHARAEEVKSHIKIGETAEAVQLLEAEYASNKQKDTAELERLRTEVQALKETVQDNGTNQLYGSILLEHQRDENIAKYTQAMNKGELLKLALYDSNADVKRKDAEIQLLKWSMEFHKRKNANAEPVNVGESVEEARRSVEQATEQMAITTSDFELSQQNTKTLSVELMELKLEKSSYTDKIEELKTRILILGSIGGKVYSSDSQQSNTRSQAQKEQDQIDNLTHELKRLKKQHATATENIVTLRTQIATLETDIKLRDDSIATLNTQVDNITSRADNNTDMELCRLRMMIAGFTQVMATQKIAVDTSRLECRELRDEKKRMLDQMMQNDLDITSDNATNTALLGELKQTIVYMEYYKTQCIDIQRTHDNNSKVHDETIGYLQQARDELEAIKLKLAQSQNMVSALQNVIKPAYDAIVANMPKSTFDINSIDACVTHLIMVKDGYIASLQARIVAYEAEKQTLTEQTQEVLKTSNEQLQAMKSSGSKDVKTKLEKATAAYNNLYNMHANLEQANSQLQTENTSLQGVNINLRTEGNRILLQLSTTESNFTTLQIIHNNLNVRYTELHQRFSTLNMDYTILQTGESLLSESLTQTKTRLKELRVEYNQLKVKHPTKTEAQIKADNNDRTFLQDLKNLNDNTQYVDDILTLMYGDAKHKFTYFIELLKDIPALWKQSLDNLTTQNETTNTSTNVDELRHEISALKLIEKQHRSSSAALDLSIAKFCGDVRLTTKELRTAMTGVELADKVADFHTISNYINRLLPPLCSAYLDKNANKNKNKSSDDKQLRSMKQRVESLHTHARSAMKTITGGDVDNTAEDDGVSTQRFLSIIEYAEAVITKATTLYTDNITNKTISKLMAFLSQVGVILTSHDQGVAIITDTINTSTALATKYKTTNAGVNTRLDSFSATLVTHFQNIHTRIQKRSNQQRQQPLQQPTTTPRQQQQRNQAQFSQMPPASTTKSSSSPSQPSPSFTLSQPGRNNNHNSNPTDRVTITEILVGSLSLLGVDKQKAWVDFTQRVQDLKDEALQYSAIAYVFLAASATKKSIAPGKLSFNPNPPDLVEFADPPKLTVLADQVYDDISTFVAIRAVGLAIVNKKAIGVDASGLLKGFINSNLTALDLTSDPIRNVAKLYKMITQKSTTKIGMFKELYNMT